MGLIWWEYVLIAAIFASILTLFSAGVFGFMRVRVQKWIGGAIGNFMTNLANQAAEEGAGNSSPGSSPGTLELGGFKIDPQMLGQLAQLATQYGPQLVSLAQQFGLMKGGTGGSTGGSGL